MVLAPVGLFQSSVVADTGNGKCSVDKPRSSIRVHQTLKGCLEPLDPNQSQAYAER